MLLWIERRAPDVFCHLADAVGMSISLTAVFGLVCCLLGFAPGWLGGLVFYAAALLVYRVVCTDEEALNWKAEDIGNLRVALNALVRVFRMHR